VGVRIDGHVWSAAGPGCTVRGWAYPRERQGWGFAHINGMARGLNELWLGLTDEQRENWQGHVSDYPEYCVCPGDWDDWEPAPLAERGRLAWINTQLSLARRGKAMQVDYPGMQVFDYWHEIHLYEFGGGAAPPAPLQCHVDVAWFHGWYQPGPCADAMIWGRVGGEAGTVMNDASKYRWWGWLPLTWGDRYHLDDLLAGSGALLAGKVVSLRIAIAEPLLAPYCWARRDFLNIAL